MRGYMTISDEEKNAILQTHSAFYNGYATGNVPSGPQPLRQDEGPNDTNGITINNRGEVGQYRNHSINETIVNEQEGKGCSKSEGGSGCIKRKGNEWIIMNNKKGGVWRDGFKSEKDAEEALDAFHANNESYIREGEVNEYAADDMDVSDVESAYDFDSGGPEQFDDSTSDISDSYGMDIDSIMQMFGGEMSAAEYDDIDSDMNQDLDGKEKYSGEMAAYNFNSDGAMDGETYEEVDEEDMCEGCGETYEEVDEEDMCEGCGETYEEVDEEDMCEGCGETYEDVDEDLMEDFIKQKDRIVEMFDRFKKFI